MPRYFFDVADGGPHQDETGTECATLDEVRNAAMAALPSVAKEQIPHGEDRRIFSVVAKDESGNAVYAATLSYVGLRLKR